MDCACLIHGDAYDWSYVDNLYWMLARHLGSDVCMHVFTEPERSVPAPYIRHDLDPWPTAQGPRAAWWNKLQLFQPGQFPGWVLYFDLDVIIVQSIRWMRDLDQDYFWTIRDFRHLWRPNWTGINSSIMAWQAPRWTHLVHDVNAKTLDSVMQQHPGDQDYLTKVLSLDDVRFFDPRRIQSWRWQVLDGGMDMHTRQYRHPGAGPVLDTHTDVVIFHGRPKPHQIDLPWIHSHWRGQIS